jgi:phosphoserine aminotransferase
MSRKIRFTPGPTELHPAVRPAILRALDEDVASISHRGAEFRRIFERTTRALRSLLAIPESHEVFFLGSGTECMERVVQNCVRRRSLHLVNGAFSARFRSIAAGLGRRAERREVAWGAGFDLESADVAEETELLSVTQNETSTGVTLDLGGLARLRERRPDTLVAVDMVSAAPGIAADFPAIDCAFFSVQKGFGMPAGLAVLVVGPRAIKRSRDLSRRGVPTGTYRAFASLSEQAAKHQTPETPNVLAIFVLGEVCAAMLERGIEAIRDDTRRKAAMLYDALEQHPELTPFVTDRALRSPTVIVAEVRGGSRPVIERLASRGLVVSAGYGEYRERHLRIANFPAHTERHVRELMRAWAPEDPRNG